VIGNDEGRMIGTTKEICNARATTELHVVASYVRTIDEQIFDSRICGGGVMGKVTIDKGLCGVIDKVRASRYGDAD
jgi:hypothetical protein